MPEIILFVEDYAHQAVVGALTQRVAGESDMEIKLTWRSARGGHGRVVQEYRRFSQDLDRQAELRPDIVIVATDANCKGLNERARELGETRINARLVFAIPDPHVERWLLLDGAAFRAVFERGCDAPDQKCERDRYKRLLNEAIRAAGVMPSFGGIEFADDIVKEMNLDRASRSDRSLERFLEDLRTAFRELRG